MEIQVKLGVGAPFIEISAVTDIYKEQSQTISHKPGQIMLIDFWATWCHPCQAPMAHNHEMLEHHGARWGDKVRIIGISIDEAAPAVVKHVQDKKWEKVEHFHRAGSSCSEDYGVNGVPHVVLIDGEGKIAFVGHPMSTNLEQGIEKLLKGEKLGAAGGDDDDEESGESFAPLDLVKIREEMSRWEGKVEELAKNDKVKQSALGLKIDHVIVQTETKYDIDSAKFVTSYQNINALVGAKASCDAIKPEIESFVTEFKGSFKSDYRVHGK
jgi:thiol-disulfide isomerase/thioredoxin